MSYGDYPQQPTTESSIHSSDADLDALHDHHMQQQQQKKRKIESSHKKIVVTKFDYKKSDQTKKFLRKRIQQELLFENWPSHMIRIMVQKMYRVDIPVKQNVVCAGDPADAYFVIEKGGLEVWEYPSNSDDNDDETAEDKRSMSPILKDTLETGDTFGYNALLYATTDPYTYRAQSKPVMDIYNDHNSDIEILLIGCRCWVLSQENFDQIRQKQVESRLELESSSKLFKFVKSIAMFKDLESVDLQEIVDAMICVKYRKRDKIICEGDSSTHFFIIYRGTCDATKIVHPDTLLKSYGIGDCFGELGIMKNQSRAATVIVTSDQLIAYALPALDFKLFLNYDVIKQAMHNKIKLYKIPDDCKSFENKIRYKLEDFKEIGCLGIGTFARVICVESPDNEVYALKKVKKNHIIETSEQEHIVNEKRILAAIDCVFCVKLLAVFQDKLNVFFLLEPVMGGELFSLLRHKKRLGQRTAAFYCACVVLAFDYLHTKLNVIYRNLCPENVLIGINGYCKLVDFIFAKKRNNTCTLYGIQHSHYLPPEVIQNFAPGFAVDWWSVGIFLYEIIFGYAPFQGDKNMKMCEKILVAPVEFPDNIKMRSYTKDIIHSLLRKQAHKRLGSGTKGADSVKKHSFFKRIDWNRMAKQELDPPWKPRLKGPHDLSAFDTFPADATPENEKLMDDPDGDLFKWCNEF